MEKYDIGKDVKHMVSGKKNSGNYPTGLGDPSYKFARGFGETPANEQKIKRENRNGLKKFVVGGAFVLGLTAAGISLISNYGSKTLNDAIFGPPAEHTVTLSEAHNPFDNLIAPCAKKLSVKPSEVGKYMNDRNIGMIGEPLYFGELEVGQKVKIPGNCE